VEVHLHAFFTSALYGGKWSASSSGRFTTRERAPGTRWIGGWVGPRAGLNMVSKRKIPSPRRESKTGHLIADANAGIYLKIRLPHSYRFITEGDDVSTTPQNGELASNLTVAFTNILTLSRLRLLPFRSLPIHKPLSSPHLTRHHIATSTETTSLNNLTLKNNFQFIIQNHPTVRYCACNLCSWTSVVK
jgi:hypothetical protein